jgi:methylglutaconyl-CoA hydratase
VSALLESVDARGVATLTLNRPERHNAFDDALIAELTAALIRLGGRSQVRAVVLASAGRSFSAGADVAWMRRVARQDEAANLQDALALAGLLHTLDRLEKPTVAVVQGPAYGGGVGLVACCDIAVSAERATFCLSEVRLGIIPATIAPFVIRAIGARAARRYFATAETIPASRAQLLGLVHEVVPEDALEAKRDEVLRALLAGAPGAQTEAKDLVFLCEGPLAGDALAQETARRIAARRSSPEGQEGLSAFLEKRAPAWRTE